MKNRPRGFFYLALILIAVAIGIPLQIIILYGHPPSEVVPILAKIAPLNWVVILFCSVGAFVALRASSWLFVVSPLIFAAVGINNYIVGVYETNFSASIALLSFLGFLALHGMVVTATARQVLSDPSQRWWLIPERHRYGLPVFVKSTKGHQISTSTFDISKTGAFISLRKMDRSVRPGDQLLMDFFVNKKKLSLSAKVIRCGPAKGKYPQGVGVQFLNLDLRTKVALFGCIRTISAM